MPGTDDRAADSRAPEPLRRTDPPHGPRAAEPSLRCTTPPGVKQRTAANGAVAASGPSHTRSPWSLQAIPRPGTLLHDAPAATPLRQPLPAVDAIDAEEVDYAAGDVFLRLHAADLIDRLQEWSRDLDARQSQLNLQSASQDQRERQFRLWTQAREAELQARLRTAEQREKELRESARRLALAELGNAG